MLNYIGRAIIRHCRFAVALFALLALVLPITATAYAATPRSAPQTPKMPDSTFQAENLGGIWQNQSSPNATTTWGPGRTDQFIVGENGQLYHYWLDPTPHLESWGGDWTDRSGLNTTRLAAVSWGSPRLDVFLVGQDGHLYHYWQNGGNVYYLEQLPIANTLFPPNGYVAATTWGPGRLDVFVVGYNGDLYHYWQNGGNTFTWENMGGNGSFAGEAPAAVSWGYPRLDVFIVGKGTGMMHYWQQNTPFYVQHILTDHAWVDSPPPTVVSWGPGRLDLFAYTNESNTNGSISLYHSWSQNGWTFGEESLQFSLPDFDQPNVKAVTWGPGRLDLFTIGDATYAGSPLYHFWQQNNNPFGIEVIDNNVTTYNQVSAVTWGPGRLDVFACEGTVPDGSGTPLYHFWQG
jgi:hypothetical protein